MPNNFFPNLVDRISTQILFLAHFFSLENNLATIKLHTEAYLTSIRLISKQRETLNFCGFQLVLFLRELYYKMSFKNFVR